MKLFQKALIVFSILCIFIDGKETDSKKTYSLFIPPVDWEAAPAPLASRVKITFAKKSNSALPPTINLTEELLKENLSLQDYLKAVQKLHTSNKTSRWRNLGIFQTKAGTAQLTELDIESEVGGVRMLQLIFLKDQTAHLLTAAALKEEFSKHQPYFLDAFRSFNLVDQLTAFIDQPEKKEALEKKIETLVSALPSCKKKSLEDPSFQKLQWTPFQKFLSKEFKKQGSYWQLLVLASTQEKLLSSFFENSNRQNCN